MHRSRWLPVLTALAFVGTLLGPATTDAGAQATDPHKVWSPPHTPLPKTASVKGKPPAAPSEVPAHYAVPKSWSGPAVAQTAAGAATLDLPAVPAAGTRAVPVRAGKLPVWVRTAAAASKTATLTGTAAGSRSVVAPSAAGTAVSVDVVPSATAVRTGFHGPVVAVARAGAGPAGAVEVGVDISALDSAYGGDAAARSRLVALPACALTTPQADGCTEETPVPSHYDPSTHRLVADVALPAAGSAGAADTAHAVKAGGSAAAGAVAANGVVLAADTTSGGGDGTYAATSLNPSNGWTAGGANGDFSYSYPIEVPPAPGGDTPNVALSYDSAGLDGLTSSTNSQASWIGDGWDYSPGFVERSYKSCTDDGLEHSGDLCWGGYNATLSLDGQSNDLVRDDTTGTWKLSGDDGSKVEFLTGASNGTSTGEYVKVSTSSGNTYYFGLNHLPGGDKSDPATNSAWSEPVYSPKSGDPCYDASKGDASWCQMAWRLNLDYAVDSHGNLTTYTYQSESNYYERGAGQNDDKGTLTPYTRDGALASIAYGVRLPDEVTAKGALKAPARVQFTPAPEGRCSTAGGFTCAGATLTTSNSSHWPDVPFDQNCDKGATTCKNYGESFWSNLRLKTITTQVLSNGAYKDVDSYALSQSYPDPKDGAKPTMWLDSVVRTGEDGTSQALPPVVFTPVELPNRVDGTNLVPAPAIFNRPRIQEITTETGEQIQVDYSLPDCSRVNKIMPASADTDTRACYNVKWYPPGSVEGADPVSDWFNRYQVDSVTENDPVAHTPAVTTHYTYGPAAWHYDDAELSDAKTRTWDEFRGYASVTAVTGSGQDGPQSQTVTRYLQGMDGDHTPSGGTRSVKVTDSLGEQVTDSDYLSGQTLETDTYDKAGGSITAYQVTTSTVSAPTATHKRGSGLPDLTARYLSVTSVSTSKAKKKDGSWQTVSTTTVSDPDHADRTLTVDSTADGQPETCSRDSYATSSNAQMTGLLDEAVTVSGANACTAKPTAANTVSDQRTLFDDEPFGQAAATGNPTSLQVLDHYDSSGAAVYTTTGTSGYDLYGRTVSATDPNVTDAQHPNGATTTTTYTSAHSGELPSKVTVDSPAPGSSSPWESTTTLDPARDLSLTSTDLNGKTTTAAYDGLGRLTKVWAPGRTTSQNPNTVYVYSVGGSQAPSAVTTESLTDDTPRYNVSVEIFDGQGRDLQTQATPGISAYHGRVISTNYYDSQGRMRETQSPRYDDSSAPNATLSLADDDEVAGETSTVFDGEGRATATIFSSYAQEQWRTTTAYPGADETDVTPPQGGTPTTTITDALGRTSQQWQYTTATPTGKASDADVTSYTYTPSGDLASQTDSTTKDTWSYGYDLRGRQTTANDPDTGLLTQTYNADGQLATSTDARKTTLSYDYDLIGRKTAEYTTASPGAAKVKQAAWTYDTLAGAKGQPVASIRYGDGDQANAYTLATTGYDEDYHSTGTKLTLPASEGKLAGPFTTQEAYDPITGALSASHTDARGNLPAETVNYSYDVNGALLSYGSADTEYDLSSDYDAFGRPVRTTVNPWGTEIVATDNYDQATGNVLSSLLDKQTSTTGSVQQTDYTRDPAGQITSIRNIPDNTPAQTDLQCFSYDYLGRLTTAWSDTGGTTTAAQPKVPAIGGCTNSTPTSGAAAGKTTVGGPAAYWNSYSYDVTGNRTGEVQHNTGGDTSKDITTTQKFVLGQNNTPTTAANTGGGTGGPHALLSTTSTGPGNPGATSYQYDAVGDTTAVTSTSGTTTLTWTPEDELASIEGTATDGATTYLYDADGNLLLRHDPTSTTLSFGDDELTLNTATDTVTDSRTYQLPNGLTAIREAPGSDNVTWQLADQQGTSTLAVDATTLAETRRPADPFGVPRGTQPTSWAGDHGFVGGIQDDATGLTNLGAREYQPTTGRFLNPDPLLDASDPQQWNGYAYSENDPVDQSDPTGQRSECGQNGDSRCDPHAPPIAGGTGPTPCQAVLGCAPVTSTHHSAPAKSKPKKVGGFTVGTYSDGQPTLDGIRVPTVRELYAMDPNSPNRSYTQQLQDWVHSKCDNHDDVSSLQQFCDDASATGLRGDDSGIKLSWADLDPTGIVDTYNCVRHGKSCGSAAIDVGMDLLFQSEDKTAAKIAEQAAAKGLEDAALDDGGKAIEKFIKCATNSFPGDTPVLLASGKTKPIDKVAVGDHILATDPLTSKTRAEKVIGVIKTLTDTDFTDLTLDTGGTPGKATDKPSDTAAEAEVTSTQHHPYWDVTRHRWVNATDLHAGDSLRLANGTTTRIRAVHDYTGHITTYNLTVANLHTYYVLAGATPVLVHNTGTCITAGKNFKSHFIKHKNLLTGVTGNRYSKLAEDGPRFLSDLTDLVNDGTLKYEGLGTLKKDTPAGMIYRGSGVTLVTTQEGEFWTLLESGSGMDNSIRMLEEGGE